MNRTNILQRRLIGLTWMFIFGLVISGVTAIPLTQEVDWLAGWFGIDTQIPSSATNEFSRWLLKIREALLSTDANYRMLFYGTDWLAFGHLVIALAFVGALRDPVRNRWLFDFGLIACAMVIPFALCFGAIRGLPFWWRMIDCSFGIIGAIPLLLCRKWSRELEVLRQPV